MNFIKKTYTSCVTWYHVVLKTKWIIISNNFLKIYIIRNKHIIVTFYIFVRSDILLQNPITSFAFQIPMCLSLYPSIWRYCSTGALLLDKLNMPSTLSHHNLSVYIPNSARRHYSISTFLKDSTSLQHYPITCKHLNSKVHHLGNELLRHFSNTDSI